MYIYIYICIYIHSETGGWLLTGEQVARDVACRALYAMIICPLQITDKTSRHTNIALPIS